MYLPPILQRCKDKGYDVYTRGDYNLNIVGIRSPVRVANSFDDALYVIYKEDDCWIQTCAEITTDCGLTYMKRPINPSGSAFLVGGQYKSAYKIAKHRGAYFALCQVGVVRVYRDDNKDNIIDLEPQTIQQGYFGINIHKRKGISDDVNGASAGCQVFRYEKDFDVLMRLARLQVQNRGFDRFTYTLLED